MHDCAPHYSAATSPALRLAFAPPSTWNISNGSDQENATDNSAFTETIAQSATGQSSLGTATASSSETYSEYDSYQYGNNSFSFGSLSLSDQQTAQSSYVETGSNATFSSYSLSDGDNYSYSETATGSGQVGTYSVSSLETVTHTFDGTYTGGGTVHESSLVTTGYSNSGTISLASGEVYIPGGDDLPAPMPPGPPAFVTPGIPVGLLGPPSSSSGGDGRAKPFNTSGSRNERGDSRTMRVDRQWRTRQFQWFWKFHDWWHRYRTRPNATRGPGIQYVTKGGKTNIKPSFVSGSETVEELEKMLEKAVAEGRKAMADDIRAWLKTVKATAKYANKFGKGAGGKPPRTGTIASEGMATRADAVVCTCRALASTETNSLTFPT